MTEPSNSGSCLRGGVKFRVTGPLIRPGACHCRQCRKTTGHYFASADCAEAALTFKSQEDLRWFASSPGYRRGFCGTCGSTLFWKQIASADISIALGALDGPSGLKLRRHIHVADKGDYYDIADGQPQFPAEGTER